MPPAKKKKGGKKKESTKATKEKYLPMIYQVPVYEVDHVCICYIGSWLSGAKSRSNHQVGQPGQWSPHTEDKGADLDEDTEDSSRDLKDAPRGHLEYFVVQGPLQPGGGAGPP